MFPREARYAQKLPNSMQRQGKLTRSQIKRGFAFECVPRVARDAKIRQQFSTRSAQRPPMFAIVSATRGKLKDIKMFRRKAPNAQIYIGSAARGAEGSTIRRIFGAVRSNKYIKLSHRLPLSEIIILYLKVNFFHESEIRENNSYFLKRGPCGI